MKKRNLLLVILAVLLVFGLVVGCGDLPEGDDTGKTPGGGNSATLNGVTANGSGLETTTELTLTFDKAISGLAKSNITLGTGATIGNLSGGTGGVYKLTVTGVTANATVSVTVTKSGWTISGSPATVDVKYSAADAKYLQKFQTTYVSTTTAGKQVTETIDLTNKALIKYFDNDVSTSDPDKIEFTVTKWEDAQVPASVATAFPPASSVAEYTKGIKLTGKITAAKPSAADKIYGTMTCPGLNQTDLNTTEVCFYIYFSVAPDQLDICFVKTPFSKTSAASPTTAPIAKREYRVIED